MSTTETRWGAGVNAEAIQAWDGPLFDRFVKYRHILVAGLGAHGDEALRLNPPLEGQRILDIGCGFGDTTQQIAAMVGPSGEAVGVDAAENFIDMASSPRPRRPAWTTRASSWPTCRATTWAGPTTPPSRAWARCSSSAPWRRCGTCASRWCRAAQLTMVVWRRREDNEWLYRAQQVVEGIVSVPRSTTSRPAGPGPFSMANADTVTDQLMARRVHGVSLRRCDLPILGGNSVDQALEIVMSIGPAGEILRLLGDRAEPFLPQVDAALREAFKEFQREDGSVWGMASTWIVTATTPEGA